MSVLEKPYYWHAKRQTENADYLRNSFMSVPRSLVSRTHCEILEDRILPPVTLLPTPG